MRGVIVEMGFNERQVMAQFSTISRKRRTSVRLITSTRRWLVSRPIREPLSSRRSTLLDFNRLSTSVAIWVFFSRPFSKDIPVSNKASASTCQVPFTNQMPAENSTSAKYPRIGINWSPAICSMLKPFLEQTPTSCKTLFMIGTTKNRSRFWNRFEQPVKDNRFPCSSLVSSFYPKALKIKYRISLLLRSIFTWWSCSMPRSAHNSNMNTYSLRVVSPSNGCTAQTQHFRSLKLLRTHLVEQ